MLLLIPLFPRAGGISMFLFRMNIQNNHGMVFSFLIYLFICSEIINLFMWSKQAGQLIAVQQQISDVVNIGHLILIYFFNLFLI